MGSDGAHRDRARVRGRIRDTAPAAVARGANHDAPAGSRVRHRVRHRRGSRAAAEGQVQDSGAVVGGPADRVRDPDRRAASVGAKDFQGHEARERRHACDADSVVRGLRDGARDVRAVAVIVGGVVAAGEKVVPAQQARGIEIVDRRDSGVDDRDRHAGAARRVPRGRSAGGLEVPLLRELRVVWNPERLDAHHGLGEVHVGTATELLQHRVFLRRIDAHDEQLLGFIDTIQRIVDELLVREHLSDPRAERVMFRGESLQADVDQTWDGFGVRRGRDRNDAAPAADQSAEQQHEQREERHRGALHKRRSGAQRARADGHLFHRAPQCTPRPIYGLEPSGFHRRRGGHTALPVIQLQWLIRRFGQVDFAKWLGFRGIRRGARGRQVCARRSGCNPRRDSLAQLRQPAPERVVCVRDDLEVRAWRQSQASTIAASVVFRAQHEQRLADRLERGKIRCSRGRRDQHELFHPRITRRTDRDHGAERVPDETNAVRAGRVKELIDGGAEVLQLVGDVADAVAAGRLAALPLRRADASIVEAQRGKSRASQRPGQLVDDRHRHRSTERRVRRGDDARRSAAAAMVQGVERQIAALHDHAPLEELVALDHQTSPFLSTRNFR